MVTHSRVFQATDRTNASNISIWFVWMQIIDEISCNLSSNSRIIEYMTIMVESERLNKFD